MTSKKMALPRLGERRRYFLLQRRITIAEGDRGFMICVLNSNRTHACTVNERRRSPHAHEQVYGQLIELLVRQPPLLEFLQIESLG